MQHTSIHMASSAAAWKPAPLSRPCSSRSRHQNSSPRTSWRSRREGRSERARGCPALDDELTCSFRSSLSPALPAHFSKHFSITFSSCFAICCCAICCCACCIAACNCSGDACWGGEGGGHGGVGVCRNCAGRPFLPEPSFSRRKLRPLLACWCSLRARGGGGDGGGDGGGAAAGDGGGV